MLEPGFVLVSGHLSLDVWLAIGLFPGDGQSDMILLDHIVLAGDLASVVMLVVVKRP